MTGAAGQRPGLPPTRHPPVDQTRVAGRQHVRPQPQPLHHPGPASFDHNIDLLSQREAAPAALVRADVDSQRAQPEVDDRIRIAVAPRTIDPEHLGAQVGQQHGRMRSRPDARKLHHTHPGERPRARRALVQVVTVGDHLCPSARAHPASAPVAGHAGARTGSRSRPRLAGCCPATYAGRRHSGSLPRLAPSCVASPVRVGRHVLETIAPPAPA